MDTTILAYLHETLGVTPRARAWPAAAKLPYFLQDAFEVRELTLLDRPILMAIEKRADKPVLASVRDQVDKLRQMAGLPVLYVTRTLASWERKRLVEYKVPFLVPGNQLYLPDLGIDLREVFRRPPTAPQTPLSPATQAVLITALLRQPWRNSWRPAEVARDLGYTAMTLSRAVGELTAAGIATAHMQGRVRWLHMERSAEQTWDHALPLLRSPVKRRVWVRTSPRWATPQVKLAGLSALARASMLADPPWPVHAVSPARWKAATQAGIEPLPEPMPGVCEWELWQYDPALVPDSDAVDPLSLTLSLQDHTDERVQLALDELKGHFPW